jgi:proline iminopeptidase
MMKRLRRTAGWMFFPLFLIVAAGCGGLLDPDEPGNLVPRTVDEDPNLPALEMAGSRFHVQTRGDRTSPVIIFLHGGPGGDHRALLRLAESYDGYALSDDFLLVFWDQRGTGLSRRHDKTSLNIDQYVVDLEQLVAVFSPNDPVLLVGNSWGGMYATEFINRFPGRVCGAVLMEPGPFSHEFYKLIEDDLHDTDVGSEWLNDWVWSQEILTPDDHARLDYQRCLGIRDSQPRFHEQKNPPSPFWRLGAAANRYLQESGQNDEGEVVYDFTANLGVFTTEVLFLASGLNEVIGRDFQLRQAAVYPNARLEIVEGCGHDFSWVKPAETLSLIRQYIQRLEHSENGGD